MVDGSIDGFMDGWRKGLMNRWTNGLIYLIDARTNTRTRRLTLSCCAFAEAAKRKSGQYNRNAAYEEEVRRDESRKAIRRARRHASNLARERLQQQHRHGHNNNPDDDDDEEDDDIYDDDDDNSQDDAEHLPVGDEPWDITAHGHGHGSRQSRKSNRPARKDGASGKTRPVAGDTSEPEEYFDDADDESKDISEDDDGEETEVGEGGSSSAAAPSRGKGRSSLLRKKRHGKLRPIRRRLLDPAFGEDTLDGLRQEVRESSLCVCVCVCVCVGVCVCVCVWRGGREVPGLNGCVTDEFGRD